MSKRVKVDHYTLAKQYAIDYLRQLGTGELPFPDGISRTLEPGPMKGLTLYKMKFDMIEIVEMLQARRGLLDIKEAKTSEYVDNILAETRGLEDGIKEFFVELGYFVSGMEFVIGKSDEDVAEENLESESEGETETEPYMRQVYVHPSPTGEFLQ